MYTAPRITQCRCNINEYSLYKFDVILNRWPQKTSHVFLFSRNAGVYSVHRNLIEYKSTSYFNHVKTKLRQKLFAFLYTRMLYHSTGITYLHRMHDISQISQVVVYFLRFQCFPIFITITISSTGQCRRYGVEIL